MNLDIGCGYLNREKGAIGLDIDAACKPNVQGDIQDLPFKDESFDVVNAVHVLEHVPNIVKTFNEVWRVLKPNGEFNVRVPLFPTLGSICDPTHVRFFIPDSFGYFCEKDWLTGLKHTFKMKDIFETELSLNTKEIVCQMIK